MSLTKSIEASGKTVKDAIKQGLLELGCDLGDVETEVLEIGSPGLFGMFGKHARVKLTVKDRRNDYGIEMPKMSLDSPAAPARKKDAPKQEAKPAPVKTEEDAEQPKPKRQRNRRDRKSEPAEPREDVKVLEPAPVEPEEPFTVTDEADLTEESKVARTFLTDLTEKMGVPAAVEVCQGDEMLRLRMSGDNMSLLIGRRGETLDAIQYLTSLNINRGREDYLRVNIDTENYRAKREEALRKLAVRMAARAKKTGRRVALEPMNPYERRILHSALQNDPAVATHSEGEEPYRKVIITLK